MPILHWSWEIVRHTELMAIRSGISCFSRARCINLESRMRCPSQRIKPRTFHASSKRPSEFLDTCCTSTHHLLDGLHAATGLSWGLTLPLVALILRSSFGAPAAILTRKQSQLAASLRPLATAWAPIFQARIKSQYGAQGPEACNVLLKEEGRAKAKEMGRMIGIKPWVAYLPLLQLPFWLVTLETLRRMCGVRQGLLSYLAGWIPGTAEAEATSVAESARVPIEASFASEGILWFPDLLVSDPKLILPVALSGALWMNVSRHTRQMQQDNIKPSGKQVGLQRFMLSLALVAFPIGLQMPSAMVLYWTSSALIGLTQNHLIDRFWPLPKTPTPCNPAQKRFMKEMGRT